MTTHRGSVPGLPCAFPLGELLPGVYFDDDFVQPAYEDVLNDIWSEARRPAGEARPADDLDPTDRDLDRRLIHDDGPTLDEVLDRRP